MLLPLVVQGISTLVYAFRRKRDSTFRLVFYLSTLVILFLLIPKMSLADYRYFSQNPVRGELLRKKLVDWLNNHASTGDWVVLGDSGLIPYASPLNFIDSYCLNNLEMTHHSSQDMYQDFCERIWQKKPRIIILTSLTKHGKIIYTPSDACLKTRLDKYPYKLSTTYESSSPGSIYRYEVYEIIFPSKKS